MLNRKLLLASLTVVFLAGPTLSSPLQDGAEERLALARRIRERLRALDELSDDYDQARDAHERQLAAVDRQIARLKSDLDRTRDAALATRSTLAAKQAALSAARKTSSVSSATIGKVADVALTRLEALSSRIAKGIPLAIDARRAALAAAARDISSKDALERARGIERLQAVIEEELLLLRVREVRTELLPLPDGSRKHARVAQLGLVNMLYELETGEQTGFAGAGGWEVAVRPQDVAGLRQALEMLASREIPEIIELPFSPIRIARDRASEEGAR